MRTPALLCVVALATIGCEDKKTEPAPPTPQSAIASAHASAPVASSAASVVASATPKEAPLPPGVTRFELSTGKGTFLIDAPLEKIKGMSDEVAGELDVNAKDLAKSKGTVRVRLSTLKTSTFDDADKNSAQTEHARNWMEVGKDSSAESRMKYEWATFKIASLDGAPASLADAKEENGARTVNAKVSGDLTIHGVTSKKVVPVTLKIKGPADAPVELTVKTDEPMAVSLKEHDIKPRDGVGSFLNGALERIGKKIDDKVQVSFEATAKAHMPAHP